VDGRCEEVFFVNVDVVVDFEEIFSRLMEILRESCSKTDENAL
jgi:hypothetical protein